MKSMNVKLGQLKENIFSPKSLQLRLNNFVLKVKLWPKFSTRMYRVVSIKDAQKRAKKKSECLLHCTVLVMKGELLADKT